MTFSIAGSGTHVLTSPSQLLVTVTAEGLKTTYGAANPRNYFHVGLLTWGDAAGMYAPQPIVMSPQRIALPPSCTVLGYSMIGGATANVTEVAAPAVAKPIEPYDRNPQLIETGFAGYVNGGQAQATGWTYTVPAGRVLEVAKAGVRMQRVTASSVLNLTDAFVYVNGTIIVFCIDFENVVGNQQSDDLNSGPLWLPATTNIHMEYVSTDTGGAHYVQSAMIGTLFDA